MFVPHSTILVEGLVAAGIIGERAVALGSSLGRFTARIFPESATAASTASSEGQVGQMWWWWQRARTWRPASHSSGSTDLNWALIGVSRVCRTFVTERIY